jgi:Family of unknown function (DUF6599)
MNRNAHPANHSNRPHGVWMILVLAVILLCLPLGFSPALAGSSDTSSPLIAPPPDLKASGPAEHYSPETLWEKINGQADFYLSAGFVSLSSQLYEDAEDVDTMIEVNVYHMGAMLNAFSVFSLQRRDDARVVDVASFAYQTDNAVYLVHGPFYVEILWIQPLDGDMTLLITLAEQFVGDTTVKGEDVPELALFPLQHLVKGSTAMIAKNAFGFDPLDRVFTAEYTVGQEGATAYISKRKTDQEARDLVKGLFTYFKNFGGTDIKTSMAIQDARMIEIMGSFELMFSMGGYVAGVHEASSQKLAEQIAKNLRDVLNI